MIQLILFFTFAFLAVLGAVMVISHRNPIYSALFLILALFSLAGEYILLLAHFIAIVHIAVYAGDMIYIAIPMAIILFLELGYIGFQQYKESVTKSSEIGTVENIGSALFSSYLLPFEITSILLLVAMAGALFLSKKKLAVSKE
jgi:NADH-quinone oxidoreductase subunit J